MRSGEALSLLSGAIGIDCPVRLLHGQADTDVPFGISLKLMDLRDVRVGNYLPALVFAPCVVGVVSLF